MLSQKRKIDDALNNQINANNFIDQERSEILFKIKEIQNEFKNANKKFGSKNENINSEFVDEVDNTIDIENANNPFSNSEKVQNEENSNRQKENIDNELNSSIRDDEADINQSSELNDKVDSIESNISDVKEKKSNDPHLSNNKNNSIEEKIKNLENENQTFKDGYEIEKEFLIDLFTSAELKNIEKNKLNDFTENNYLISLYENNFSKLIFNYDLLFNKFLNDILN